jgi:hypothetical protein
MMKNLMKWTSLILVTFIMAASCHDKGVYDENEEERRDGTDPVKVQFSSNIGNMAVHILPAAVGETWSPSDKIGVFMVNHSTSNVIGDAANKQYVTNGDGNFNPVESADVLYYPTSAADMVDFIAYYPYDEDIAGLTNAVAVDVSNQASQEAIDLLYTNTVSTKSEGYNRTNSHTPVALSFTHQLSKITFTINSDIDAFTDFGGLEVSIVGMNTSASFSLASGVLSDQGTPASITARAVTAGQYEAIVLPGSYEAEALTFQFVMPLGSFTGTYTWTLSAATTFTGGKQYLCTVTLKPNGKTAGMIAAISAWETGTWTDSSPAAFPVAITVTPAAVLLTPVGSNTQQLTASLPSPYTSDFTYSSSNDAVATVDAAGLITAGTQAGAATITVSAGVSRQAVNVNFITSAAGLPPATNKDGNSVPDYGIGTAENPVYNNPPNGTWTRIQSLEVWAHDPPYGSYDTDFNQIAMFAHPPAELPFGYNRKVYQCHQILAGTYMLVFDVAAVDWGVSAYGFVLKGCVDPPPDYDAIPNLPNDNIWGYSKLTDHPNTVVGILFTLPVESVITIGWVYNTWNVEFQNPKSGTWEWANYAACYLNSVKVIQII